jgi:hypothetical protein
MKKTAQQQKITKQSSLISNDSDDDEEQLLRPKAIKPKLEIKDDCGDDVDLLRTAGQTRTRGSVAKALLRRGLLVNQHVKFDDEEDDATKPLSTTATSVGDILGGGLNLDDARVRMQHEDAIDKQKHHERLRSERQERKRKLKQQQEAKRQAKKAKVLTFYL